jgi:(p)ppGpp synthase/HD superfamily hydrolase
MNYRDIALSIAEKAFAGKKDKAGKPYIDHLKRVEARTLEIYRIKNDKTHEDAISSIALLHDILEDCPEWTEKILSHIFPINIVSSVKRLTRCDDQEYTNYIINVYNDGFCRIVKTADLEDNMNTTRLKELTDVDIERLKKYHMAYRILNPFKDNV